MSPVRDLLEAIRPYLAPSIVLGISVVAFLAIRAIFRSPDERFRLSRQLAMVGIGTAGLLGILLVLPIDPTLRGQLLGFVGVVFSAALALSSTTFIGNMLAGLMLRAMRNFRPGDFLRVEGHFGRVSDRSLFHTEIQTEERDLTTIPNLFLVTHPTTVIRSSGTIVSATVSLGYDVQRARIEELLRAAAERAGLAEPFVHVLELGDHSVTYRVAGLQTEVKQLLSARSLLRATMLDLLHEGGVEIVSPTFMNTRAFPPDRRFVPEASVPSTSPGPLEPLPEEVVFDKAEEAESLERLRLSIGELDREIENLGDRDSDRETRAGRVKELEAARERIRERLAAKEKGDRDAS